MSKLAHSFNDLSMVFK